MADEAILKIQLADDGSGGTTSGGGSPSGGGGGGGQPPPPGGGSRGGPFDPVAVAKQQLLRQQQQQQVQDALAKLNPPAPFDPVAVAKQRLQRQQQQQQVEDALAKLNPPAPPPAFDPVEQAKKRLQKEQDEKAVEDALLKLKGGPQPFDPVIAAKKRLQQEEEAKQIEAEYYRLKGEPTPEEKQYYADLQAKMRAAGQIGSRVAAAGGSQGAGGAITAGAASGLDLIESKGGPFGVVVTAMKAGAEAVNAAFRAAAESIRFEGQLAGKALTDNDLFRQEIEWNRRQLELLKKQGPIAFLLQGGNQKEKDLADAEAVYAVRQGINARANRLAPFSGELSGAQAQAQQVQTQTNMAEGNLMGGRLADFTRQQAELQRLMQVETALKSVAQLGDQMTQLNGNIQGMRERVEKQAQDAEDYYRKEARRRKQQATTDEERRKIDRELADTLQSMQNLIKGNPGPTPMEKLLSGVQVPDLAAAALREQAMRNQQGGWSPGFPALNVP